MKKIILIIITLITIIGIGVVKLNAYDYPGTPSWSYHNPSGNIYYISMELAVIEGSSIYHVTIPDSTYSILSNAGGYNSNFEFKDAAYPGYNPEDPVTATFDWEDIAGTYTSGVITFDLLELGFSHTVLDPFEIGVKVYWLHINIAQTITSLPNADYDNWGDYIDYMELNDKVTVDDGLKRVRFFSGITLWSWGTFWDIPTEPVGNPTAPAGYTFDGWFTSDGEKYNFKPPSTDLLVDQGSGVYDFYLYAHFRATGSVVVDTTDPATNLPAGFIDILDIIGFNNLSGYIFIFVAVLMIVIIGMVLLKLPVLAIAIVTVAITGLFIYFGMLPLWIIIVIVVAMVMIFMWDLKVKDPQGV